MKMSLVQLEKGVFPISSSVLPIPGRFSNCRSENIYSYNFILYNEDDNILENTGVIYANQFQDNKSYNYMMQTN